LLTFCHTDRLIPTPILNYSSYTIRLKIFYAFIVYKSIGRAKAKTPQTDQSIAIKKLTEDIVPVAASYEVAVQFRQSCYYRNRHSRVSGKHHFVIHLSVV